MPTMAKKEYAFYPGCSSQLKASAANYLTSTQAMCKTLAVDRQFMEDANEALKAAGLQYQGKANVKHMVEVLIEDFGYDQLAKPVVKPLGGIKFAGYVGCQTNRPFGIAGESFENPMYLDKLVETVGAESIPQYDQLAKPVVKPLGGIKFAGYVGCQTNRRSLRT